MAKKNFKSGLGSLIQDTRLNSEKEEEKKIESPEKKKAIQTEEAISEEKKHWYALKIKDLKKELHLWRTGKMTMAKFAQTLKDLEMEYDETEQQLVKKEA